MTRLVVPAVLALALATTGAAADARVAPKKRCGTAKRQFTDGSPQVLVAKGSTSCKTAKSVMRRYWGVNPAGTQKKTITVNGTKWRCQSVVPPNTPLAWECRTTSGRSVVTAYE